MTKNYFIARKCHNMISVLKCSFTIDPKKAFSPLISIESPMKIVLKEEMEKLLSPIIFIPLRTLIGFLLEFELPWKTTGIFW